MKFEFKNIKLFNKIEEIEYIYTLDLDNIRNRVRLINYNTLHSKKIHKTIYIRDKSEKSLMIFEKFWKKWNVDPLGFKFYWKELWRRWEGYFED